MIRIPWKILAVASAITPICFHSINETRSCSFVPPVVGTIEAKARPTYFIGRLCSSWFITRVECEGADGRSLRAANLAVEYSGVVYTIRSLAAQKSAVYRAKIDEMSDAEVMRYAVHYGFLRAHTETERRDAMKHAAHAIVNTIHWRARHIFSSQDELDATEDVVGWRGVDEGGRPILYLSIAAGLRECHDKAAALRLANVVISRVEEAVRIKLRDDLNSPEQIRVIVDASGAPALGASKIAWLFKAVALELTRHYPGRLYELVLMDLPVMLSWLVGAIKALVHPATREKVVVFPRPYN